MEFKPSLSMGPCAVLGLKQKFNKYVSYSWLDQRVIGRKVRGLIPSSVLTAVVIFEPRVVGSSGPLDMSSLDGFKRQRGHFFPSVYSLC